MLKRKGKQQQETAAALTRGDVYDHVAAMYKDGERFIVKPDVKRGTRGSEPDRLQCGEHDYGYMFERGGSVRRFVLRTGPEAAGRLGAGRAVRNAGAKYGDDWYVLDMDGTFGGKEEIFQILDECYDFTLRDCYTKRKSDDRYTAFTFNELYADGGKRAVNSYKNILQGGYENV